MAKNLKDLLEEIELEKIEEAKGDELDPNAPAPTTDDGGDSPDLGDDEDDDDQPEEKLEDHLHDSKGKYTPDDLKEIVKYCETLIEKEVEEDEGEDGEKKGGSDVGEIGLDLIAQYADLLPENVINQIVHDLQSIFEVEDTMLESICEGSSAFFSKSKKSPSAIAAKNLMTATYKKNKGKITKRNEKWSGSEIGKKVAAFHKKAFKSLGKISGKKLHPDPQPKGI